MQKNEAYHQAAIVYNEGLAEAAEQLVPSIEHEEVKKWCVAVGKQHRFHAKRHRSALNKLLTRQEETASVEVMTDGLDVPEPSEEAEEVVETVAPVVTSTSSAAGEVSTSTTFSDGCVDEHQPLQESCEYYPKGN